MYYCTITLATITQLSGIIDSDWSIAALIGQSQYSPSTISAVLYISPLIQITETGACFMYRITPQTCLTFYMN